MHWVGEKKLSARRAQRLTTRLRLHAMMLCVALCAVAGIAHASSPLPLEERTWMTTLRAAPAETRAKALLAKMNQTEKLAMLHGIGAGYVGNVQGNTRLGIPQLNLNDGPQGFRGTSGTSTAWPAAIAVASSWSEETMFEWGKGMGEEFFAKGANVQVSQPKRWVGVGVRQTERSRAAMPLVLSHRSLGRAFVSPVSPSTAEISSKHFGRRQGLSLAGYIRSLTGRSPEQIFER